MTTMTLTALYDSRADADQAAERLMREAGVARGDMTVHAQDAAASGADAAPSGTGESTGFFGSLKNLFMPEEDRTTYSEAISRGGFLLTARVEQGAAERATAILEEHGAVDLDDRQQTWRAGDSTAQQPPTAAQTLPDGTVVATAAAAATTVAAAKTPAAARTAAADDTISLVEERLTVGKRAVAGGSVRVRSYVVETPVQEQVSLRDETVSIERRAVDRQLTGADDAAFRDRTIEATETDEEAVVAKSARVTGEVVVRKGVEERVETVRDTVRRTEVEVEDDRAAARGTPVRGAAEPVVPVPAGADKVAAPSKPANPAPRR